MPDPTWESVSASQVAGLFGLSPYVTRFSLWHAFKRRDTSLIEAPETTRMRLGKLYQAAILARVAEDHRLDVIPNETDEYVRRGRIGCTRDAHMVAPDLGRVIVEAKKVHWLRWRDTWTETAAPMHIELQLQHQLLVEECENGLIACDTGDDDLIYHRRTANPETQQRIEEEVRLFFESLAADKEPDPLGEAIELPTLMALYPESDPAKVLEDYDNKELAEAIRLFDWARGQRTFAEKLQEQNRLKLLEFAKDAAVVRANGFTARINRVSVAASICAPHPEPKQLRKAGVQIRIAVDKTEPRQAEPDPFFSEKGLING